MKNIFPWKRFWCTRGGSMSLDDNGFLIDPESEDAQYYNDGVVSFEKIQKTPCLILLGEPGSGKTTSLNSEKETLSYKIKNSSDVLYYKNFNEYGDENRLIDDIFKSPEMINWLNGQHHLYLFLDSLDECLLEIPKSAIILSNQFQKIQEHKNRISLRITCRTGDWPESLTNTLTYIWDEQNVGIYELTPLLKKDVYEAAKISKLNPDSFIKNIIDNDLQSLASNPITLNFLLEEFKSGNQFSNSKAKIYHRGCEYLCTENNQERMEAKQSGKLSPQRRLALASRIAALMTFCNYSSILTKSDPDNNHHRYLTLSMLQEGEETTGEHTFNFTENDLRETITQTALFSGRGPNRFGFMHQSYTEFLAARYISLHKLSIQQIKSLIQISNDPEQMIIPQMKQIASWLNSMVPEIIEEIITTDPQSLLSGDIENRFRKDLVDSLLKQFEQMKIADSDWGLSSQYYKLKHTELTVQLKPYIQDKAKHFLVRRVAIDIAGACELKELQELLMDVTFDKSENYHIRDKAIHAVSKIADKHSLLKLKPLSRSYWRKKYCGV
ncbi:hypothetical protein HY745_03990, partial [Candidatus Desantisbacteria bacterium]|nr:hypothetical protein [Candidatus Desantisbacteria bacterium]